jgi:hexosaminidase
MHLDVSRHFFDVSFIKKFLDILAWYKINTFHWHLTDSHGWRLEIKQYPELTAVGAWRAARPGIPMSIAEPTAKGEPAGYGGFYTQEEVKDIIEYAKERFISIVPEIEMPGHCTAALVAYPQYADLDNNTPLLIPCGSPGDLEHNFCVGYDSTFIFLENILTEVMQLFPGPYVHIGGDEVREGPWLHCSRCRRRMNELGFSTAMQLQSWFTRRMDSFITANHKRMIGWDEVLHAELSRSSVAMYWHADADFMEKAGKQNELVLAPYHYTYFDFYQSDPALEPEITYAPLFLDTVYAFDPGGSILPARESSRILGGEACLWTENVATPARVEYMLLPRLLALSEDLWSPPDRKDYQRFIAKTEQQFKRFDALHIKYATSLYNVAIRPDFDLPAHEIRVVLSDQAHKYSIHYSTDGTGPTAGSPLYLHPLRFSKTTAIRAAVFSGNKKMGKTSEDSFRIHKATGCPPDVFPAPVKATDSSFNRLVDGIYGTVEPYDGRWVSFYDSSIRFTLALKGVQSVHSFSMRFLEDQSNNIHLPLAIRVSLSMDGKHFEPIFRMTNQKLPESLLRHVVNYSKSALNKKAKYIRVEVTNANLYREAEKNLIFLDEIVVL